MAAQNNQEKGFLKRSDTRFLCSYLFWNSASAKDEHNSYMPLWLLTEPDFEQANSTQKQMDFVPSLCNGEDLSFVTVSPTFT